MWSANNLTNHVTSYQGHHFYTRMSVTSTLSTHIPVSVSRTMPCATFSFIVYGFGHIIYIYNYVSKVYDVSLFVAYLWRQQQGKVQVPQSLSLLFTYQLQHNSVLYWVSVLKTSFISWLRVWGRTVPYTDRRCGNSRGLR